MDETNVVKLFLVIGVFALLLNVYSITLTEGFMVKMFTDFVVPMMCIEENGTYYLSMPTNSSDFCDNILDDNVDSEEMVSLCAESYAGDEEKCESCMRMVGFYDYGRIFSNTRMSFRMRNDPVYPDRVQFLK